MPSSRMQDPRAPEALVRRAMDDNRSAQTSTIRADYALREIFSLEIVAREFGRSSSSWTREAPLAVRSYLAGRETLTITNTWCKPRSSSRSLEAACPIVFSINESITSELNTSSTPVAPFLREDPGRRWPRDPRSQDRRQVFLRSLYVIFRLCERDTEV